MKWIQYAFAATVMMIWGAACVQHEPIEIGSGVTPDGKVRVTMQIDPATFAKPVVSRVDATIPNPNETEVYVIMYYVGEGDELENAECVEAGIAQVDGNTLTFTLTQRDGPIWLAFTANNMTRADKENIIDHLSEEDLKAFVDARYLGVKFGDFTSEGNAKLIEEGISQEDLEFYSYPLTKFPIHTVNFFRLFNYGSDKSGIVVSPFLNFEGDSHLHHGAHAIPMGALLELEGGVYPGMPSPGTVRLTRMTAKVTVESQDEDFVPEGIILYNTPITGSFFRRGSTIPDLSAGYNIAQLYQPNLVVEGTEMALYPYEAPKTNPPLLILTAKYKGVHYAYFLPFRDVHANPMDIVRNHHYKFVIKQGEEGILNFNLADLPQPVGGTIDYSIDVIDMSSHTIISNGVFLLGVSNEEVIVMADRGVAVNDIFAAIATTNLPDNPQNASLTHIETEGVTLVSPVDGILLTTTGMADETTSTEIKISLPAAVDEGTITIRAGGLTQTVRVRREAPYFYTPEGHKLGDDILHAELDGNNRGQNDWFKGFSVNPGGRAEPRLTRSSPGAVYMQTGNVKDLSHDVAFYYTRAGGGRVKFFPAVKGEVVQPPSNSYMVAPGSVAILIPVSRANASDIIGTQIGATQAFTAELLWTDNSKGLGADSNIESIGVVGTGNSGYIRVEPGSGTGNAVIAAKVGTNIVWSWHIWVTDYDPNATPVVKGETHAYLGDAFKSGGIYFNKKMMDRNLGATWTGGRTTPNAIGTDATKAAKAYGLMYQWGRKDPFTPAGSTGASVPIYNAERTHLPENGTGIKKVEVETGPMLSYSIQYPMTFIYALYVTSKDWYSNSYLIKNDNLWCATDGSKTVYDPCPPGWRVPLGGADAKNNPWAGFGDGLASSTDSGNGAICPWYANGIENGITPHATAGRYYTITTTQKAWYPASGKREATTGGLGNVGTNGYSWGAESGTYNLMFRKANAFPWNYGMDRADGLPVRCVQE